MATFTEPFETERRKHKGATKPKLPVSQIGHAMSTTTIWSARGELPGDLLAANVPLRFADYIEDAINLHDELVAALEEILDPDGPSNACERARAVLAKARHEK